VWHPGVGALFFTTPFGEGALYRMLPDGRVLKIRDGSNANGTQPIGNTLDSAGDLITVEAKRVTRTPAAGGDPVVIVASAVAGGEAPAPGANNVQFDTLNDVVARKDGTLYVTDPGYFATPTDNRIYQIAPGGAVQVVEAFQELPRPNGVALSPDQKFLYVGFSAPAQGTLPFIRKYGINDDGSLGEWTKFVDIGPENSTPDGMTVDKVGNVYVATIAGIEVYSPDGKAWGTIPIPEKPTGLAFGGEDMKTLYVTTDGTKIWQLKMKLPGVAE
ncbi:MAG TPA: SMP-30/gluconolactonase/LRE family protein, partial [Labilithrix sp.]|nr:SMP-30/gluconolactonase/LRE family protein [Labilithrix sp.]